MISRINFKAITNKTYINCVRKKSSAELKTKTYSHTILGPKTNFPGRIDNTKRDEIIKLAQFSELYNWQREHLKGPEFVLHDGPPYANGELHIGHAVNKIIKDINNRSQVLQGNKVHYIPGWDCHGLPIELKALQKAKKSYDNNEHMDPVQIRQIARTFALETVAKQKNTFVSWGVMADWEKQSYLTLNKNYVQRQLRQFYKMYKSGLIYRALKPVYWSPSSRTALAEAELEYDPRYKSKEVYVKFPMEKLPQVVTDKIGKNISALVWTTKPWSLVTNHAICFNKQLNYSIVRLSNRPEDLFLVGSDLIAGLEKSLGVEMKKVLEFDGHHLSNCSYRNELSKEICPLLEGHHVTGEKGTGLVHIAPAHGPDDFLVALKNNIKVQCKVDEAGCYTNLDPTLDGLEVLTDGQDEVISRLGESIIHEGEIFHSHPVDWRTKKPVFLRASQQWFIDTAALQDKALSALEKVKILPPSSSQQSRQGFKALLEKRPYWCISRQRAWGVPIPAIYCGEKVIVHEGIIDKLCSLIETDGPDVWWTCDVEQFLSEDIIEEFNLDVKQVTKGMDIMDIWLDSGLTWQTLEGKKADLYSEGVDQLTGWFQASLLTSLALQDDAPYSSVFVHGFVVDDKKRKMSKSIGNVIDPDAIIHGGKDKNRQPAYGIDTLRWWVASHSTQHSQIVISRHLLDSCQSEIIKIRKLLKYLLGVISDVKKTDFHRKPSINYLDRYMVRECHDFSKQIIEHYNNFAYNHVAQSTLAFISNKVSGLYCHLTKDRLYCCPKDSQERLSAQLVVHTILVSLCKALGPILPHLVEEVWQHHPLFEKPFHFTQTFPVLPPKDIDITLMDKILDIKRDIYVLTKNKDLKKYEVNINLNLEWFNKIKELNVTDGVNDSVLCEVLEVSAVSLTYDDIDSWEVKMEESAKKQCLRCRKYNVDNDSDKCIRCDMVLL